MACVRPVLPGPPGVRAGGSFECRASLAALTSAAPFQRAGLRTPVRVSFAPCVPPHEARAPDTQRAAHRFDVQFVAAPAAWTLASCSLPIDAGQGWRGADGRIDLLRWLWLMSDRALPRSYRMMQGFGLQTLRLQPEHGDAVFARFHWLPAAGTHALAADEAAQLAEADPAFLRCDLREAIEAGAYPRWQLALQVFSARQAAALDFDPYRDARLLPEDRVPLRVIGRLVLDRLCGTADTEAAVETMPGIEAIGPAAPAGDDRAAARLVWHSQSRTEQNHLVAACRAELACWPARDVRRLLQDLADVDPALAERVGGRRPFIRSRAGVMAGAVSAAVVEASATLSLLARPGERSIRMRRVALLLADGFEPRSLHAARRVLRRAGAWVQCVGVHGDVVRAAGGAGWRLDAQVGAMPSVPWDGVVLPDGAVAQSALAASTAARRFIAAQYRHGKPILQLGADHGLLAHAGVPPALPDGRPDPALVRWPAAEAGVAPARRQLADFIEALALPRRFEREPELAMAASLPN